MPAFHTGGHFFLNYTARNILEFANSFIGQILLFLKY